MLCCAASRAIARHRAVRWGIRSGLNRITVRAVTNGTRRVMPSSVAFWIAQSMCSLLIRARPRVVWGEDAGGGLELEIISAVRRPASARITRARNRRPPEWPSQSSSPGWMRRLSMRWCAREPVRVMPSPWIASGSMKNTGISIEHIFHLVQDTVARHIQQLSADARVLFQ